MKPSITARAALLVAVLWVAGCGTTDEPAAVSTPASTSASDSSGVSTSSAESAAAPSEAPSGAPTSTSASAGAPPVVDPSEEGSAAGESGAPPMGTTTPAVPAPSTGAGGPPASSSTFPDPEVVADQGHATNPLCEVLTVDEVGVLLGAAVRPAIDDAEGTGCLWLGAGDDSRFGQLQMLGDPARYVRPADAEDVPGVGDAAFVVAADGGWTAQAQNADGTFAVRLVAATATRDAAVEGLRRLLERY